MNPTRLDEVMSLCYTKVCEFILGDFFGKSCQEVGVVLIKYGRLSLGGIVKKSNCSLQQVREALKTLIHHNVVVFESKSGYTTPVYKVLVQRVLDILNFTRYFELIQQKLGVEQRNQLEEAIHAGQVSFSRLLFIFGFKYKRSMEGVEDDLELRLFSYIKSLKSLVAKRFLIMCEDVAEDPESLVPLLQSFPDPFDFPKLDHKLLARKLKEGQKEYVECPDSKIYWRINYEELRLEYRNSILINYFGEKFRDIVDPKVFEGLLQGDESHESWSKTTSPKSSREVKQFLQSESIVEPTTIPFTTEHLEILVNLSDGVVLRRPGNDGFNYCVDLKKAFVDLMWTIIEKVVLEKHGYYAARIFSLIRRKKFVSQETINEKGMISSKEAKNITYILIHGKFITMKEIRKTYTMATAGTCSYVFTVNTQCVVQATLTLLYKGITNSRLRCDAEKTKHMDALLKEEKINRILSNMILQKCTEDQLNDVRSLVTPPELEILRKVHGANEKLYKGIFHLAESAYIMEIYKHFIKDPIALKKLSKTKS